MSQYIRTPQNVPSLPFGRKTVGLAVAAVVVTALFGAMGAAPAGK